MKLLRIGEAGAEKPALLDEDGVLRDLSAHVRDIDGETLSPAGLARLAALDVAALPVVTGSPRIGCCVARPVNFIGIGLNYRDHAEESGMALPAEPVVFLKSVGSLCGPYDDVLIPRGSLTTDWEVELGVVIGTTARYISQDVAMDHVAGYCVVDDLSERSFQVDRGGTWDKGKGCDTFGPVGPWLVTRDEVPDPQGLALWCDVDGRRMQDGSTRNMLFDVRHVVSYLSHFMTLHPGDIIATGTPAGVGFGMKPSPVYLRAGQEIVAGVAGLGEQRQRLVNA